MRAVLGTIALLAAGALLVTALVGPINALAMFLLGLIFLLAILVRDFLIARRTLEDLLSARIGRPQLRPISSIGSELADLIDSAALRLHSLRWQTESRLVGQVKPVLSEEIHSQLAAVPAEAAIREYFAAFLTYIQTHFRCANCAATWAAVDRVEHTDVLIMPQEDGSARLGSYLRQFFLPYFQFEDRAMLGLSDLRERKRFSGDLSALGFAQSLSVAVTFKSEETIYRGVLWLGFLADTPVTDLEVSRLSDLTTQVTADFQANRQWRDLVGRITAAETASAERGEFLTQMSHDIRSPLNNLQAIMTLVHLKNEDPDMVHIIEAGLANCRNAAGLVDDILDYSRHRAGRLSAHPGLGELSNCLADTVTCYLPQARAKGVALNFSHTGAGFPFWADQRHIKRILSNLVGNAVKYTKTGEINISIEDDGLSSWWVRVADTGPGISKIDTPKLFRPFSRLHGPEIDGTGLGLALSKILIELSGGEIAVASTLGQGSTFSVRVPKATNPELDGGRPEVDIRGQKILLVDDDNDALQSLRRLLTVYGAEVVTARSVDEAVGVLDGLRPDIIITDLEMSGRDGEEVITLVQDRHPEILILVMTGRESEELTGRLLSLGARAVLVKPVGFNDLLSAIDKNKSDFRMAA